MIDFEKSPELAEQLKRAENIAVEFMRPISRYYDDHEYEQPWSYINAMWNEQLEGGLRSNKAPEGAGKSLPRFMISMHVSEMMAWGDAALTMVTPGPALAGAAIGAVSTPEQRERFLTRFSQGHPKWGAMAMTEPAAGSDTAHIQTTARLSEDGKEWVLNGEKIFCSNGQRATKDSPGLIVVWATVDPKAGRAGMKSFVVESGTPGLVVTRLDKKMGLKVSDTAAITLDDCRIPFDNILGSPEVAQPGPDNKKGFQGAMKTFDASRPGVAAGACGIARAAIEYVKDYLAGQGRPVRYDLPYHKLGAVERDVLRMEADRQAAWLLTLRAAWLLDQGLSNTLEASMAKGKAGQTVTWVTQKAVEILGPHGYSCQNLVEKWMRDARVQDLFEGTGQINRLIVARRLLGYSSKELQ
ncbi:MAG: acyl-CoA dehydrogenase family protein [Chloroflexi bacterium]|nr:acyl-CoA dehydrogenase family protein [Chloroflexota bacterium]OJV99323.1 MAG: acyl-CoA dehydrogenase [Chloroflexi bacterium 54-19]